ncbi:MAG: hypothetical protein ABNH16_07455 [Thalassolituus sp.]|jgi:hypothetical protein
MKNKTAYLISALSLAVSAESFAIKLDSIVAPQKDSNQILQTKYNGYIYKTNLEGLSGADQESFVYIDISSANSAEDSVNIVKQGNFTSTLAQKLLENYPNAPTPSFFTGDGVDEYFTNLTGESSILSNEHFKASIDRALIERRFQGLPVMMPENQHFVAETKNFFIIKNDSSPENETLYECIKGSYIPTFPILIQFNNCYRVDSGLNIPKVDTVTSKYSWNDSENYIYKDDNSGQLKASISDKSYSFEPESGTSISLTRNNEPSFLISPFFDRKSEGNYNLYLTQTDGEIDALSALAVTETSPQTTMIYNGSTITSVQEQGGNSYIAVANTIPIPPFSPNRFSITSLKVQSSAESAGFLSNFDSVQYETFSSSFMTESGSDTLIAAAYFPGTAGLVATPVIYNYSEDVTTYLSSITRSNLEEKLGADYIAAVDAHIFELLPQLTSNYPAPPELPIAGLDEDLTSEQLQAVIDELVVRLATQEGAYNTFITTSALPDLQIDLETELSIWNTNALRFTNENTLQTPFAIYKLRPDGLYLNVSSNKYEIDTSIDESAEITVYASGTVNSMTLNCKGDLTLSAASFQGWGGESTNSISISPANNLVQLQLNFENDQSGGTALLSFLAEGTGFGTRSLTCSGTAKLASGEKIKVYPSDRNIWLNDQIHKGTLAITGSVQVEGQNENSPEITGTIKNSTGYTDQLNIFSDNRFVENFLSEDNYQISLQADGYVFPCLSVELSTSTDIGDLVLLAGDLNNDGEINGTDQWRFYFRAFYPSTDFDLNNDGVVNNTDRNIISTNRGAVQCDL